MSTRHDFDIVYSSVPAGRTLIEASAGTGKTFAITGLFIRLVLEGLTPRQILVTTFTEAATAELRGRIRTRLHEAVEIFAGRASEPFSYLETLRAECADRLAPSRHRLESALRSFDEATITTIHGFCHSALREHALESGELFDAELLTDDAGLRRELAEDFWRRTFYVAEPCLAPLARSAGLNPEAFATVLRDSANQPLARLAPPPSAQTQQDLLAAWQSLRSQWPAWKDRVGRIFADASDWANKPYNDPEAMAPALAAIDRALTEENPHPAGIEALGLFATSALLEKVRKKGPGAPSHPFFDACEVFSVARDRWLSNLRSTCAEWGRLEGERRRRQRNQLSFTDLLTRLHAALHSANGAALAARLRARFGAALIDEFQDTDGVQADIFEQVFGTGETRLVLIGDPKQAIYSFRGADIFSYLAASRKATERYDLPANHRSEHGLVAAVNHLFGTHARPFAFEDIRFAPVFAQGKAEQEPLRIDGQRPTPLRFWFWEAEADKDLTAEEAKRTLPGAVAAEIARLLAADSRIGEARLKPGDFAILVRENSEAIPIRDALSALGIPAAIQSGDSVFASAEATELRILLAAIAAPARESLVRAALGSGLLGLNAADLHRLDTDQAAWETQLQLFQTAHALWQQRGFMPMFREVMRAEQLRRALLMRPDGERQLTNLLHLAEVLHAAAVDQRLGLEGLLAWFDRQTGGRGDVKPEYELRLERDEAAVQVLTLHKSKGLEFEIVFCPSLWKGRDPTTKLPIRAHAEDGGLILDFGSEEQDAHAERASDESLAEDLRLLYVALTRARRHCVVVWGRFNRQSGSALAWLLHARHGFSGRTALAEYIKGLSAADMRRDLETIAAASAGTIAVESLPTVPGIPIPPKAAPDQPLAPRRFHSHIDRSWLISSFSSLAEHGEAERPDHDSAPLRPVEPEPLTGIHAFPRGRKAGTCLHEIFEEIDFADERTIAPVVTQKLEAFGLAAEHIPAVVATVERTLDSDLGDGAKLRGLPARQRLCELEFVLGAASFSAPDLSAALGDDGAGLEFDPRRGLLKGYIDLVAAIDGRFFIIDWKSNWHGSTTDAYTPEALQEAMHASHYGLQYQLYTLALHRYLRVRLPDYDYATHFGGVAYFFLRGLDAARPELGVYRTRPSETALQALDQLFTP